MSHPTYVERKQLVPSLSHRPKVQPRSEVNPKEVNKQDKYCSPQQTSPIYPFHKPQIFQIQMFDLPQTVSQQVGINHPCNIDLKFPKSHVEQEIETSSPIKRRLYDKNIEGQQKNIIRIAKN